MTTGPWKVGTTQSTSYGVGQRFGHGLSVQDARGMPLVTIVYATEEESKQAESAVRKAIENAVHVEKG
jgi:hypothetical protein